MQSNSYVANSTTQDVRAMVKAHVWLKLTYIAISYIHMLQPMPRVARLYISLCLLHYM